MAVRAQSFRGVEGCLGSSGILSASGLGLRVLELGAWAFEFWDLGVLRLGLGALGFGV